MRNSIIVAMLIALLLLASNTALASETDNTNTKIETSVSEQILQIKNFLAPEKASASVDSAPETANVSAETNEITAEIAESNTEPEAKTIEKTSEEVRYEQVMNRWKTKQAVLWNNLPKDPFIINASAYTAAADECGKSDGITASGIKVAENRTIACPPQFPFGAKISIEGMGTYVCEDRGGAIKGNHIDIYVETKAEAFKFGRRNLKAEIVL